MNLSTSLYIYAEIREWKEKEIENCEQSKNCTTGEKNISAKHIIDQI